MEQNKKHLRVVQDTGPTNQVIEGTTCFAVHAQYDVDCQRKKCPHWLAFPEKHNCVLIAAQDGPHTLQTIGQIYGLTRMRICQIEKGIFEKVKQNS